MDFSQIWEKRSELFVKHAQRFGLDASAAEDLIQDLAIEAIGRQEKFHNEKHFERWAFQVIRHRALDYLARGALVTLGDESDWIPANRQVDIAERDNSLAQYVRSVLQQVPARQKEVLERIATGSSTSKIAEEMGVSATTIRSLKRHALAFMRTKLSHFFKGEP